MNRLIIAVLWGLVFTMFLVNIILFYYKTETPLIEERKINDSLKTLKQEILSQQKKDSILILNNELQRIRQSNINK